MAAPFSSFDGPYAPWFEVDAIEHAVRVTVLTRALLELQFEVSGKGGEDGEEALAGRHYRQRSHSRGVCVVLILLTQTRQSQAQRPGVRHLHRRDLWRTPGTWLSTCFPTVSRQKLVGKWSSRTIPEHFLDIICIYSLLLRLVVDPGRHQSPDRPRNVLCIQLADGWRSHIRQEAF
jgi:hypothetical protein